MMRVWCFGVVVLAATLCVGFQAQEPPESQKTPQPRSPRTFLRLDDGTLRVTAGTPVRFVLQLPGGETWSQANIGQFQVRTFGAVVSPLPEPRPDSKTVWHTFESPGQAMVILCAGPAATAGRSDSWQRTPYCTKLLVRIDPPARGKGDEAPGPTPSGGLTAKAGTKVEIRPTVDPTSFSRDDLARGADFPVRVYYEGSKEKNVPVVAMGPGGVKQTSTTDTSGFARFRIHLPGHWRIRYERRVDGLTYRGDLLFEAGGASRGGRQ